MALYSWSLHERWRLTLSKSVFIALGANLGSPIDNFDAAFAMLLENGCDLIEVSGLWQSPSWPPNIPAPDYVNACAKVEFSGNERSLLALLHRTEAALGRTRDKLNAPRSLDLDLLDFRGRVLNTPEIEIPHPRMMDRGFVLFPLSQIAPDWKHPVTDEGVNAAISRLKLSDVSPMLYLGRHNFIKATSKRSKIAQIQN